MAVDTDSLFNQAIDARTQREARLRDIDAQSQRIGQQLRNTNRRDRGRIAELQSQARGLEQARTGIRSEQHSDDLMTNLRVQSQFRNAHLSNKALEDQRHEETARQTTNITDTLARLEAKYPNRGYDAAQSNKFSSEVEQLGNQNEMGARSQKGRQALFQAAQFHDQVRQKTLANAANKLSTLTKGGLTPEEFAKRDHSKDFTTNATDLSSATSDKTDVNKRPKLGADLGVNTVFEAGGAKWMIPTTSFSHFDSNFKLQPTAQTAPIVAPPSNVQPLVPTYSGQGAAPPGGLVRNPDGSIEPIIPTHTGEGAAAPGAMVRTDVGSTVDATPQTPEQRAVSEGYRDLNQYNDFIQTGKVTGPEGTSGESAKQARLQGVQDTINSGHVVVNRPAASQPNILVQPNQVEGATATLPSGVQPNQPIQPALPMQDAKFTATQPGAAPQVAQQPTATPHPMEGQTVRHKESGQIGTITNGIFVPNQQ